MLELILIISIIVNIVFFIKINKIKDSREKEKYQVLKEDILSILDNAKFKNNIAIYLYKKYGESINFPFPLDYSILKTADESIDKFRNKISVMEADRIDFENKKLVKDKEEFADLVISHIIENKSR